MNYAKLFSELEEKLTQLGEEPESLRFVYREIKNISYTDFVLSLRDIPSDEEKDLIFSLYKRLAQHEPAQYILGWADFCDLRLKVDNRVLIPRPETEELVALILSENNNTECSVLDIGTGSGAIALSLKSTRPTWNMTASDLSLPALNLAKENAQNHSLDIKFIQSDVFDNITGTFDIIVSNPPYIDWEDRDEVGINVIESEPHHALFAEEKGLAIYRKIIEQASQYLSPQGRIYFEIGYKQGQAVSQLLKEKFPQSQVSVVKDIFDKDRIVVVYCE